MQMGNPLEKVLPPCLSTTSQDVIASVNISARALSHVRLFVTPWTVTCQAPLSIEFSRQEYWSGLPCPSPEDLSDPGIEPGSPALQAFFYHLSYLGSPLKRP